MVYNIISIIIIIFIYKGHNMKTKIIFTVILMAALLAACAPKATPAADPTMEPMTTEAMESMEPTTSPSEETAASPIPTEIASATSAVVPSGNVFEVEISNFEFEENTITIKVGDTVTWTNHDSARHTVVADDGQFKSSNLSNDAIFSHTFDRAGTYPYHCGLHSSMNGTVIVQP